MNRINHTVVLARWIASASFVVMAGQTAADGVVIVPGQVKGYLYDQSSNQVNSGREISLAVVKQGTFKEYRIESDPPGLVCDETCPETAQQLPVGTITLRIVGKKPAPGLDIPLTGLWSEPCDDISDETARCIFNLNELNARVTVEVDPDVKPGMLIDLPEGGQALLVKVDLRENYMLVAHHTRLSTGLLWMRFRASLTSDLDIKSPTDGPTNTAELRKLLSPAAMYCTTTGELGTGWYLPAENELALMTPEALKKVAGLNEDGYLWSSTENRLVKGTTRKTKQPYMELRAKALNNKTARIENESAYSYDQQPDGSWQENAPYSHLHQVLCFRRLPF